MFGVGGGIVQGPVMLEMGVLPEVIHIDSHSTCKLEYAPISPCCELNSNLKMQIMQKNNNSRIVRKTIK